MSDNEFDNIPDDFDGIEGVDWIGILAGPSTIPNPGRSPVLANRSSPSADSSTHYSCDDEEVDSSFLEALDVVEQNLTQAEAGPSRVSAQPNLAPNAHINRRPISSSGHILAPDTERETTIHVSVIPQNIREPHRPPTPPPQVRPAGGIKDGVRSTMHKRIRSETPPSISHLANKKGKWRAEENEGVKQVLSTFEDELTCPICCDIFVATHVGNPCGHSFCGDCGLQWMNKNSHSGCAVCRAVFATSMPMIPNITTDNIIEKHVQALGCSGNEDWLPGGAKYVEWTDRKERWRKGVAQRAKKPASRRKAAMVDFEPVLDIDLTGWFGAGNEDEDDGDYARTLEADRRPARRRGRRRGDGMVWYR